MLSQTRYSNSICFTQSSQLFSFLISPFLSAKFLHHHLLCHLRWIETQNRQRRQIDHLFKEVVRVNRVSGMPTRDSIDRVQEQRGWRAVGRRKMSFFELTELLDLTEDCVKQVREERRVVKLGDGD